MDRITGRPRQMVDAVRRGESPREVARRFGVTRAAVYQAMWRHGVSRRPAMPARPRGPLSDDEIHRRREEAARARAEHERQWLERERLRYGLARIGRPLSEMVA